MEGRDPDYQRLAVKGLIGSSKRVLSGTKDPKKVQDIKDGVKILEKFIEDFDSENRSRLNWAYLPSEIVSQFSKPKDKLCAEFVKVYADKKNYKHLRTLFPADNQDKSWDIIRNKHVNDLKKLVKEKDKKLFDNDGKPTEEHLGKLLIKITLKSVGNLTFLFPALIHWAYSPQPDKVKSYLESQKSTNKGEKRKSGDDTTSSKKKK